MTDCDDSEKVESVEWMDDDLTIAYMKGVSDGKKQSVPQEVREALEKISSGLDDNDSDYYDGWTHEYKIIADKALSLIAKEQK